MMLASVGYDVRALPDIVEKTGRAIKNGLKDWAENPFRHLDFEKRNAALRKLLQDNPRYAGSARNAERFRRMTQ
jgi:hypothetical protein